MIRAAIAERSIAKCEEKDANSHGLMEILRLSLLIKMRERVGCR